MTPTFASEITVADVRRDAPSEFALRAAESVTRAIHSPHTQKLGLARAGFAQSVQARRVQIVGRSEVWIRIPGTSWRDLLTLIGVAVRNHLLKRRGGDAMHHFVCARAALSAGDAAELR